MSLEKMLQDRYENKNAMSIEDILFELQIEETEPASMLIAKRFAGELNCIRVSVGIDYIIKHL